MKKLLLLLEMLVFVQQAHAVHDIGQLMHALAAPNLAHVPAGVPASAWQQAVLSLREHTGQILSVVDEDLNNTQFTALIAALVPVIRSTIFMIDASGNHLTHLPLGALLQLPRLEILNLDRNHLATLNGIEQLYLLTLLRILNNPLTSIPATVWTLPNLLNLYIDPVFEHLVPIVHNQYLQIHYHD